VHGVESAVNVVGGAIMKVYNFLDTISPIAKGKRLRFFGDRRYMSQRDIVVWFEDILTITDSTECGLYVAHKTANYYKPEERELYELLVYIRNKYGNLTVESYNNGIAWFFDKYNIKCVDDLIKYLEGDY
jgi:hypothetical protein